MAKFWKYRKYRKYRPRSIYIENVVIFSIFSIFWYFRKYHDIFEPWNLYKAVKLCENSISYHVWSLTTKRCIMDACVNKAVHFGPVNNVQQLRQCKETDRWLLTLTDVSLWVATTAWVPVVVLSNNNTLVCRSWMTGRPVGVLHLNWTSVCNIGTFLML